MALASAAPAQGKAPRGEFRQNGLMLLPSMAGIMFCAIPGYSLGVMIAPLEKEFGWSRAEISSGPLIISMIALFIAPLVGLALDRFGSRRIGILGVMLFGGALALLSNATPDIRTWWALWVLLGIAAMFVIPAVWTAAINAHFDKNRGMALALALCGTGIGGTIYPSLTYWLVAEYGWRGAYIGLAIINVAVVLPLVVFLFRGKPVPAGSQTASITPMGRGMTVRQGLRSARFIKLAASALIFSVAGCALTTNAVPMIMAEGIDPAAAAGIAGLIGIGSIIGRLGGGLLLDRFNANRVAAISVLTPVIAVAILLSTQNSPVAVGLACFITGLSIGTEVDACAYLAARHLGLRSFGTLFGAINGLLLFGAGLAPLLANHVYDVVGSYDIVLWVMVVFCVISSWLFLALGPYPDFTEDDDAVEQAAAGVVAPA